MRRLAKSFQGLDRSPAQSIGELQSCKISDSMHDLNI